MKAFHAITRSPCRTISRRRFFRLGSAAAGLWVMREPVWAGAAKRRVVVWSEGTAPKDTYPKDINGAIAEGLQGLRGWEVITAGIEDPDQGLPADRLDALDVLVWWGHQRHREVKNSLVDRIVRRVKEQGMGFIALHSSHFAKPYKKLMGTACSWREYKADGTSVKISVREPKHPIARGVKDFGLPKIERYGEPFAVPEPEAVVFEGLYRKPDGQTEPGRMGMCWTVGRGKVFYLTPGHETYDDFYRPEIRQILRNAVQWAAPAG